MAVGALFFVAKLVVVGAEAAAAVAARIRLFSCVFWFIYRFTVCQYSVITGIISITTGFTITGCVAII